MPCIKDTKNCFHVIKTHNGLFALLIKPPMHKIMLNNYDEKKEEVLVVSVQRVISVLSVHFVVRI